jgi:hypothetical protein
VGSDHLHSDLGLRNRRFGSVNSLDWTDGLTALAVIMAALGTVSASHGMRVDRDELVKDLGQILKNR